MAVVDQHEVRRQQLRAPPAGSAPTRVRSARVRAPPLRIANEWQSRWRSTCSRRSSRESTARIGSSWPAASSSRCPVVGVSPELIEELRGVIFQPFEQRTREVHRHRPELTGHHAVQEWPIHLVEMLLEDGVEIAPRLVQVESEAESKWRRHGAPSATAKSLGDRLTLRRCRVAQRAAGMHRRGHRRMA